MNVKVALDSNANAIHAHISVIVARTLIERKRLTLLDSRRKLKYSKTVPTLPFHFWRLFNWHRLYFVSGRIHVSVKKVVRFSDIQKINYNHDDGFRNSWDLCDYNFGFSNCEVVIETYLLWSHRATFQLKFRFDYLW